MSPRLSASEVSFPKFVTVAVAAVLLVAGCSSAPTYKGVVELPEIHVADLVVPQVDSAGSERPFALRASPGGVLALFFGFTNCPDQCPTTLSDLSRARSQLGDRANRVDVAFVTVDLERDTAPVLARYVDRFGFESHGRALRPADETDLGKLTRALFASSEVTKDAQGQIQVGHTAWTYVIDDTGKVVLEWEYGVGPEVMEHDLELLTSNNGHINNS